MRIGVIQAMTQGPECLEVVRDFGLDVCQLMGWDVALARDDLAQTLLQASVETGVDVCAVWAGVPGPAEWNFTRGPVTLGLVPEQYRVVRVAALKKWARFSKVFGAPAIITHCGFLPENMTDANFAPVADAIRDVSSYCASLGIGFWFETGQETPVALLRMIETVGTGNLGINLDPANLLMYGKGNPLDALDVFGAYVRNVHVKDGMCPVDPKVLGPETKVGEGKVNFPAFLGKLRSMGFDGELIIEREISGEQQAHDIRETVDYLRRLLNP
jgi:L-ribulose-5-phosphate 3-epimerase